MIPMDLNWIAKVLGVKITPKEINIINIINKAVTNINTDTRTITSNEVFLALKGPNFDGHKFVHQAINQGAVAVIVEKDVLAELDETQVVQFIVDNTQTALGLLASAVKDEVSPKTIAITGSVGKTTVKEMTASILGLNAKVLSTKGNFNNEIGVPLTLLRLEQDDEYAVIELGANHLNEIAYTCNLVKPDVATICNVAAAHLEGFGDIDGVATAKGEIFSGLDASGIAVLNYDSEYHDFWFNTLNTNKVLRFSTLSKKDVWAENITFDHFGRAKFTLCSKNETSLVQLKLPGKHNIKNALTASALTLALNIPLEQIATGLSQIQEVKGRVNLIELTDVITIIDDSYNANVQSVKAGIDLLKQIDGYKVLALGDMGELGENELQYHEEVGRYAQSQGINLFYTLGALSEVACNAFNKNNPLHQKSRHFTQRTELLTQISRDLCDYQKDSNEKITILVKGSRSAAMELLVQDIIKNKASLALQNNNAGDLLC
ncbi:UDP-N-acetylmuramoyl-tripeptide--D-alanyl-D-alanine ligase [Pseudoalteromonas denitrificans]|uniref:UDP-N-acetylmuramoyl-tripeptide--D-alanyl-D-alanine ligase n=1 Tax=Pseudoalteromonas denitrificans DSM 6059 TaxID=1123010 RepID=A0A1I1QM04_9GAMM|nr:UDP-N-acetylmuramoyl-tripeptide--D-alanyl-D-alanine ligase [Pseudoalteromonas denitrificans]SFD23136.1 UDP-N-acetylmuramoyl-tripeptide--D-alanyl-D-alanine ligase [Pseudoalteromonas denitrificans DSM 6059]